jgi:ferredoxin
VFAQDAEGVVVLLEERPDERLRSAVEAAVDSCPAMCIDLED